MLSYLSFLLIFIVLPLVITGIYYFWRYKNTNEWQKAKIKKLLVAILGLAVIALIYTTPWDNFLVENSVWYYESSKVLGIIIGFVPLEEYTFFVLQTMFIGLLFGWFLLKEQDQEEHQFNLFSNVRVFSVLSLVLIWMTSLTIYIGNNEALTYLNLILLWGIPPIAIQLVYGADILWLNKSKIAFGLFLATSYLSTVDSIAIIDGIWTISKNTSTGILLGGALPIEEFLFFLTTNILIIFGLTLIINSASRKRFEDLYSRGKGVFSRK